MSEAEKYLLDFHARFPGSTTQAFAPFTATMDQQCFSSSYACLIDSITNPKEIKTILDLGCGDGYLLKTISDRYPDDVLLGIDFSKPEIELAKKRLGNAASVQIARAQSLPFKDGSIDFVLSHMALMLMDDVPLVVSECSRVLKPGGVFSAIVGRRFLLGPVLDEFIPLLISQINESGINSLQFGGAVLNQPNSLERLFERKFTKISVADIDIVFSLTLEDLWKELGRTYSVDRLPAPAKIRLRDLFFDAIRPLINPSGLIETGWGLKKISAIRRHDSVIHMHSAH